MVHTVLLIQAGSCPLTRTYTDFDSLSDCLQGICTIYEDHLKERNPGVRDIHYNVQHLYEFLEELFDVSCLIYQNATKSYGAFNKSWIKEKIYIYLLQRAISTGKELESRIM